MKPTSTVIYWVSAPGSVPPVVKRLLDVPVEAASWIAVTMGDVTARPTEEGGLKRVAPGIYRLRIKRAGHQVCAYFFFARFRGRPVLVAADLEHGRGNPDQRLLDVVRSRRMAWQRAPMKHTWGGVR